MDDTAFTAGTPTDDPELLEQFDGNLEDADASASQVYAAASRSFQEAHERLARVKSARGYFPGPLVTVRKSWMTLHTQLVLRQMTQNFLNSLMAIWRTLMRPRLKCTLRQVAVSKKHMSVCLVSRVPEAMFLARW